MRLEKNTDRNPYGCTEGGCQKHSLDGWLLYGVDTSNEDMWNGRYCHSVDCLRRGYPQLYEELVKRGEVW